MGKTTQEFLHKWFITVAKSDRYKYEQELVLSRPRRSLVQLCMCMCVMMLLWEAVSIAAKHCVSHMEYVLF